MGQGKYTSWGNTASHASDVPTMSEAKTASTPWVEALALRKQYGTTTAVRDVSFKVYRGEVVGFLGPNGAGKSTTMKMLTGYLKPSGGTAKIAGYDVAQEPMQVRRALGYLPENAPLYDDMMVLDFLQFIAELRGVSKAKRRTRIQHAGERCGLEAVLGKDIGQLSKGYRQRVGLAQALLHDPDLLILDEPTSGLDPNQIIEIRALIRDLGRDKTVILSTHILPEVQATCDRILIINNGQLVADDRPEALSAHSAMAGGEVVLRVQLKGRQTQVLEASQVQAQLAALPGVRRVVATENAVGPSVAPNILSFTLHADATPDIRETFFEAALAAHWLVLELHRDTVSLEAAFRQLTATAALPKAPGETHA